MPSFSDNFNRANGVLGSDWTAHSGTLQIISDEVRHNGTFVHCAARVATATASFAADQQATVSYTVNGTSDNYGPAVRMSGTTCYGVRAAPTASGNVSVLIERWSSGSGTTIGVDVPLALRIGDTLSLRAIGATLTLYHNGVSVATRTDANFTAGQPGMSGFSFGDNNTRIDNFVGTDVFPEALPRPMFFG